MTRETIAANLMAARRNRGLTRGQLSLKTGLNVRQLVQYETGEHTPGAINLALMARALRVSSDRLLGLDQ